MRLTTTSPLSIYAEILTPKVVSPVEGFTSGSHEDKLDGLLQMMSSAQGQVDLIQGEFISIVGLTHAITGALPFARPLERTIGQHPQVTVVNSAERSQIFGVTLLEYPETNVSLRAVSGT